MNLTTRLADKIAKAYDGRKDWTSKSELDKALAEVVKRQGGLCACLTDDAKRDFILTLGANRRRGQRQFNEAQAKIAARRSVVDIAAE